MYKQFKKKFTENFLFLLLFLFIILSSLVFRINHNDFAYYTISKIDFKFYSEYWPAQAPLSYFINNFLSKIFTSNYDYLIMRLFSIFYYILSLVILSFSLKEKKKIIIFILLSVTYASSISYEIGNYTLALFFFTISYFFYFEKKNSKVNFFLGSFFFGLCISSKTLYCVLIFILIFSYKKTSNFKTLVIFSTIGGLIGLLPIIFYLPFDLDKFLFWNFKLHLLFNEVNRFEGFEKYFLDLFVHFKKNYFPIMFLFLYFFFSSLNNLNLKIIKEFFILFFLFISGLVVFVVQRQYFEPFVIFCIYFLIKNLDYNKYKNLLFATLVFGLVQYIFYNFTYYKELNSQKNYFFVQNIKNYFEYKFSDKQNCKITTRTSSGVYLPYNFIQHKHNPNGIWFYQLRNLDLRSYEKYLDIDYKNNFSLDYNRNEFNSILVGHYRNDPMDNRLVEYAKSKKWKKYSYRDFDFYIDKNCL